MNYAQTLKDTYVFKAMPESELKKLATLAATESLPAGTTLFREGEKGADMYVIAMGSVRVLKKDRNGMEEEIATLGTGSYFGEMSVVSDEHERTATIMAVEPTTLLVLQRATIDLLCSKDDKLAHHFYKALTRGLVRRLYATSSDAAYYKSVMMRHQ